MTSQTRTTPAKADIDLNAEDFFADMIASLAENLEETIGLEDSATFISAVGLRLGEIVSAKYRGREAQVAAAEDMVAQIGAVCVDLKARIGGDFFIEELGEDYIVFGNRRCPFGDRVVGHPSLCMMTNNVFGRVAADRAGYASVHIDRAIAAGDNMCRVIVRLTPSEDCRANEFFG